MEAKNGRKERKLRERYKTEGRMEERRREGGKMEDKNRSKNEENRER